MKELLDRIICELNRGIDQFVEENFSEGIEVYEEDLIGIELDLGDARKLVSVLSDILQKL